MLKQQSGYFLSKVGAHCYLLPYGQSIADQKHGIRLNETGEFLWNTLHTPQSMDALVTALASHYNIERSEYPQLAEDVREFVRQLCSLGLIRDDFQPTNYHDIHVLSIAGLTIGLSAPEDFFPEQFADFCIQNNSSALTDMKIEIIPDMPKHRQNGTVLLRNKELVVMQCAEGYLLLFPSLSGVMDVYLTDAGDYARIYCRKTASSEVKENLFHVIRHLFLYRAQLNSSYVLHSASILYQEKAWLFSGHSGMGKSTHTALWHELFQTPYLNGDLNLITFQQGQPVVHGIPWCGTSGICTAKNYPLGGIILLNRGQTDYLETLSPEEKVLKVMQRLISPAWIPAQLQQNLDFSQQLTGRIPVYQLFCTKEPSAAYTMKAKIDEDFLKFY